MKTIAQIIGYTYMLATLLAMFDLVDMNVCIGKPGACIPVAPAIVKATTI